MSSLIEAYFSRDLSLAEDEELAQHLAASPEAAEQFAGLAESDWKRLGLPAPLLKAPRSWTFWAAIFLTASGALAFGAWNLTESSEERIIRPALSLEGEAFEVAKEGPLPIAKTRTDQIVTEERLVAFPDRNRPGYFTLQLMHASSGTSGAAVYDAGGRKLKNLANQGQGRWNWDGLLASGQKAPPGRYELIIERDGPALAKWVEIEKR